MLVEDNPSIHSICIHGDSANSVEITKIVRNAIEAKGYIVEKFITK